MAPTERGKARQGAAARGCWCCAAAPRPATRSHLAEPPETHERPVGQRRRRVCGEQRHCAGRERHLRRLCERADSTPPRTARAAQGLAGGGAALRVFLFRTLLFRPLKIKNEISAVPSS